MARPFGTKAIKDPQELWDLFEAYCKEVKGKPIKKMVFVGKDGGKEWEERERPLTMEGFENYLFYQGIINSHLKHYGDETNPSYADYLPVITHVKKIIREDQLSGGMAGIYQHTLTARMNGLVEKSQVEVKSEQPLFNLNKKDE